MTRPRLLFASYHCYHDPSSGAAVCTRDLFAALTARDDPAGFPVAVVTTDPPIASRPPTPGDAAAFRAVLADRVARFRPDVVLTYGGDAASTGAREIARAAGAKVVFWLHNFAYTAAAEFVDCVAVVVPSMYSREQHRTLGLECVALPPVIDPARVLTDRADGGQFVTLVNPEAGKGLLWFARLAEVLGRARPDIRFLVVEGRGKADALAKAGLDWTGITSVRVMANTPYPRRFYRLSRLLVVPSATPESFGRVAAEAMLNGIPVLASDCGALPETVGDGGLVLPLPATFTAATRTPPTADEVRPWADALVHLWDNPSAYQEASQAATEWAERWHSDAVTGRWEEFLTAIGRPG